MQIPKKNKIQIKSLHTHTHIRPAALAAPLLVTLHPRISKARIWPPFPGLDECMEAGKWGALKAAHSQVCPCTVERFSAAARVRMPEA